MKAKKMLKAKEKTGRQIRQGKQKVRKTVRENAEKQVKILEEQLAVALVEAFIAKTSHQMEEDWREFSAFDFFAEVEESAERVTGMMAVALKRGHSLERFEIWDHLNIDAFAKRWFENQSQRREAMIDEVEGN